MEARIELGRWESTVAAALGEYLVGDTDRRLLKGDRFKTYVARVSADPSYPYKVTIHFGDSVSTERSFRTAAEVVATFGTGWEGR